MDINTTKLVEKLRVIAIYAEGLANELDAIDSVCECGSKELDVVCVSSDNTNEVNTVCAGCGKQWQSF